MSKDEICGVEYERSASLVIKRLRANIGEFALKDELLEWSQQGIDQVNRSKVFFLKKARARKYLFDSIEHVNRVHKDRYTLLKFFQEKIDALRGDSVRISRFGTLGKFESAVRNWHTIDRHVGKTVRELFDRLQEQHRISEASAFYRTDMAEGDADFYDSSRTLAENAVAKALSYYEEEILDWLDGGLFETKQLKYDKKRFVIPSFGVRKRIGIGMPRGGVDHPRISHHLGVILSRDPDFMIADSASKPPIPAFAQTSTTKFHLLLTRCSGAFEYLSIRSLYPTCRCRKGFS